MKIKFSKYHALLNEFIIVDGRDQKLTKRSLPTLARLICDRKRGVGADGLLYIAKSSHDFLRIEVYNADGSWAEKSGNGLRIVGLHENRQNRRHRSFNFEMGGAVSKVVVKESTDKGAVLATELGTPLFETKSVPVKSEQKYMINSPLNVNGTEFPVICLSIGNPHTVLFVDNFDFDWQQLGADIETNKAFPNGTNVEFVKVLTRKKLKVVDWERGAGATGSSGTGAAAAVAAAVMLGAAERKCDALFEAGTMNINWRANDNVIELTGPAQFICEGQFVLP